MATLHLQYQNMHKSIRIALAGFVATALFFSCKKEQSEAPVATEDMRKAVVETYSRIAYQLYQDTHDSAHELLSVVQKLVANPSQLNLENARAAYIAARTPYGQTDAFRFYGGPIDDEKGTERMMNGWPLDEAYIDYVVGNSDAGIINDSINYPIINRDVLEAVHEVGGKKNISTGYHAIEFLLWGQDLSEDGPGNRPYTDYVEGVGKNAKRRGQYLIAVAEALVYDLHYTEDEWKPGADNYRKTFESQDPNLSLRLILTGLGKFTKNELFGERMSTAYGTQQQEDEHSCFSDQTHMDFILGEKGVLNVFYGRYGNLQGKGIYDLVNSKNAAVSESAQVAFTAADVAVKNIHSPFDVEITTGEGRARVYNAIQKGNTQAETIHAIAEALGLTVAF